MNNKFVFMGVASVLAASIITLSVSADTSIGASDGFAIKSVNDDYGNEAVRGHLIDSVNGTPGGPGAVDPSSEPWVIVDPVLSREVHFALGISNVNAPLFMSHAALLTNDSELAIGALYDVKTFAGLEHAVGLTEFDSNLTIRVNNFDGLDNIVSVNGQLDINFVDISGDLSWPSLENVSGPLTLENTENVDDFSFDSLKTVDGLIDINNSDAFSDAFPVLESAGGINFTGQGSGILNFPALSSIGNDIIIHPSQPGQAGGIVADSLVSVSKISIRGGNSASFESLTSVQSLNVSVTGQPFSLNVPSLTSSPLFILMSSNNNYYNLASYRSAMGY